MADFAACFESQWLWDLTHLTRSLGGMLLPTLCHVGGGRTRPASSRAPSRRGSVYVSRPYHPGTLAAPPPPPKACTSCTRHPEPQGSGGSFARD